MCIEFFLTIKNQDIVFFEGTNQVKGINDTFHSIKVESVFVNEEVEGQQFEVNNVKPINEALSLKADSKSIFSLEEEFVPSHHDQLNES
jgi:hypothetical protein